MIRRARTMVFAGEFWEGASGRGLGDGFRDDGWSVQEIDQRDFGVRPSARLDLRVLGRLTRSVAASLYRERILQACRVLRPDVLMVIKGIGITIDLLKTVRAEGVRTVMFYPDVAFDHHGVDTDSFRLYDLFVTTKTFQHTYLNRMLDNARVAHVPHGYVGAVHRPVYENMDESNFVTDVLHAGNHSLHKQHLLEDVAAALPDVRFRLVGNRWTGAVRGGTLSRCDMPGERIGVAYAEAIQTARINVAVHMGITSTEWFDLVSTRTFEIPACGGFMLHIDNDEVREYFIPGTEIDVFSDAEELTDKVRFYLERPEVRAKMIARAYTRTVPSYGYAARANALSRLIGDRLGI